MVIYEIFCPLKNNMVNVKKCWYCKRITKCDVFKYRIKYIDDITYLKKNYKVQRKINTETFELWVLFLNNRYRRQLEKYRKEFTALQKSRKQSIKLFEKFISQITELAKKMSIYNSVYNFKYTSQWRQEWWKRYILRLIKKLERISVFKI